MATSDLRELLSLFMKLGTTAFGGPAAHIAMMEHEVVRRRQWLSRDEFLDLIGAVNLIPGPNSTELAIYIGYKRGGAVGMLVAGTAFILPAFCIVLLCAYFYVQYGILPQAKGILYGIKPVIIAILFQALLGLGRTAIRNPPQLGLAIILLSLSLIGQNELLLLFLGGGLLTLFRFMRTIHEKTLSVNFPLLFLFLNFLKIGSVLYGSGYVLLAFLEATFVEKLHLLTQAQLLDAVAVGQFTPGPVFTTATFIGFLISGYPGAIVATIGIFLPSFIFVGFGNVLLPRIRKSPWARTFLDGVNIASLALMAGVTATLSQTAWVDLKTLIITAVCFFVLVRFKINSFWLVLGGAAIGLLSTGIA